MNDIEILIALVAAAIVLVRLADAISIPYPIVLVLGGLGIGFIPGGPTLELQPDVVFLVFLPPLLQSAGYWASPKELMAEIVPLTWLVIGLTLATMVAVAAVAQAVIPSINWAEGFVLGAIVAPTDPVAAIATFQRVGVTDRVATLVEGESMIMRGAVSLAAALALPLTLDSGATFGSRDLIVYLTVAVIFVTLVGQGLTLPRLVKALGLSTTEPWAPDEAVARLAAAQAALDRLDELESGSSPVSESAVQRLRELYQARFARCVAALQGEDAELPIENPLTGYRRLREDLIKTERETLLGMRNDGRVRQDLFRRIQRDLDLDEARLGT